MRGQGRYWAPFDAGRGVRFWGYGDPIIYEDRDEAHKAAVTVGGRVVPLVSPSEKLRAAIVKELRALADEHSLYVNEDPKWAHSSETLSAVADRIERGEVG